MSVKSVLWEIKRFGGFFYRTFESLVKSGATRRRARYTRYCRMLPIRDHTIPYETFGEQIYYIIDGKQRLTTIHKFMNNEFPVEIGSEKYFYKDFDDELKTYFDRNLDYGIEAIFYYSYPDNPITDDEKIQIFNFYNFTGTPQAEEHKIKLQNLLK